MLNKLYEAQKKMQEVKERLDKISVTGKAGNDDVVVDMNGNLKITSVKISDELVTLNDKEQLEDLISVACNRALDAAQNVAQAEMAAASKGLLPGIF
ncbi:MAG TPA: YbaB/EbfC family nucleoid-associated protein [Bacteroidia bacterium]|nr:YbaB/EbfC family nucleoid-associated protein [Bacteroidia bacterium]HNU32744.1 YbaB/EbfC family nucleoid-associated protein [Bacteroidia bacterium]